MEKRYIAVAVLFVFIILVVSGYFLSQSGIDVNGCAAKWSTTTVVTGKSDLCPSGSCTASAADQQHNAIVEAMVCACAKATTDQFASDIENKRIEDVTTEYFGYTLSAAEICGNSGNQFLVRHAYE
jgi:hypothetical protein